MHCPNCGSDCKDNWKFCMKCAKPLPDENGNIPEIVIPDHPVVKEVPKTTPAPWLITLSACIIFYAIFTFQNAKTDITPSGNVLTQTTPYNIPKTDSLQIQTGWTWKVDNYGYSKINGSVKNIGTKPITYFEVTAEYSDANGKVIDTSYTNSNERINPGNEKRFEILHKYSPDFKGSQLLVNRVITD